MNILGFIIELIGLLGRILFGALAFCARAGVLTGSVAGTCFGLMQVAAKGHPLSNTDLVILSLLLTLVGWITVLLVVGVWLHYGLSPILWPAFVNALLTSFVTVFLNYRLNLPIIAAPVGILVGIAVGTALCYFCRVGRPGTKGADHV